MSDTIKARIYKLILKLDALGESVPAEFLLKKLEPLLEEELGNTEDYWTLGRFDNYPKTESDYAGVYLRRNVGSIYNPGEEPVTVGTVADARMRAMGEAPKKDKIIGPCQYEGLSREFYVNQEKPSHSGVVLGRHVPEKDVPQDLRKTWGQDVRSILKGAAKDLHDATKNNKAPPTPSSYTLAGLVKCAQKWHKRKLVIVHHDKVHPVDSETGREGLKSLDAVIEAAVLFEMTHDGQMPTQENVMKAQEVLAHTSLIRMSSRIRPKLLASGLETADTTCLRDADSIISVLGIRCRRRGEENTNFKNFVCKIALELYGNLSPLEALTSALYDIEAYLFAVVYSRAVNDGLYMILAADQEAKPHNYRSHDLQGVEDLLRVATATLNLDASEDEPSSFPPLDLDEGDIVYDDEPVVFHGDQLIVDPPPPMVEKPTRDWTAQDVERLLTIKKTT